VCPTLGQFAVLMVSVGSLCALGGLVNRLGGLRLVVRVYVDLLFQILSPPDDVSGVIRFREEDDTARIRAHHRQPPVRADASTEDRVAWLEYAADQAFLELANSALSQEETRKNLSELRADGKKTKSEVQLQVEELRNELEKMSHPGRWEKAGILLVALGGIAAAIDIFVELLN
jgi:hypothetical protein